MTANSATREMVVGDRHRGVIVGGWYVSGHLGYLPEDPAQLRKIRRHQLGTRRVVQLRRRSPICFRTFITGRPVAGATFGCGAGMLNGSTAMAMRRRASDRRLHDTEDLASLSPATR
jgi:hypothetical protein